MSTKNKPRPQRDKSVTKSVQNKETKDSTDFDEPRSISPPPPSQTKKFSIGQKGNTTTLMMEELDQILKVQSATVTSEALNSDKKSKRKEFNTDVPNLLTDNISPSQSPEKSRPRLDDSFSPDLSESASYSKIDDIQATEKGISEVYLKNVILALNTNLESKIDKYANLLQANIDLVNLRIEKNEKKIEVLEKNSDLAQKQNSNIQKEVQYLRGKLADLEDRDRRNNIKLRGISERVGQNDLRKYVKDILTKVLPSVPESELLIERIHRLPRPRFIPPESPRDTILKFHFFPTKEKLLNYMRTKKHLPSPYDHLQIFSDLSKDTIQARKNFHEVTALLRKGEVLYKWGFPTKLLITYEGKTIPINTPQEGMSFISSLGKGKGKAG